MTKHPGGRPTVMTPATIAKLEEAFAWGCSDVEACLWANIGTKTLYMYQERNPEFAQRKAELKEKPILLARKSVVNTLSKDAKLAMDFLSRKKKDEFSTKSEQDITSAGNALTPILVEFINSKADVEQDTNTD